MVGMAVAGAAKPGAAKCVARTMRRAAVALATGPISSQRTDAVAGRFAIILRSSAAPTTVAGRPKTAAATDAVYLVRRVATVDAAFNPRSAAAAGACRRSSLPITRVGTLDAAFGALEPKGIRFSRTSFLSFTQSTQGAFLLAQVLRTLVFLDSSGQGLYNQARRIIGCNSLRPCELD